MNIIMKYNNYHANHSICFKLNIFHTVLSILKCVYSFLLSQTRYRNDKFVEVVFTVMAPYNFRQLDLL